MRAMILTTSRKPSRKTRSFAKALSRFLNWQYVQRGKISLKEFENKRICVISEIKGNPAFLNFYDGDRKLIEIFLSVSNVKKTEIDRGEVVYFGDKYNFFEALPAKLLEKFDKRPHFLKKIVENGNELLFYIGEDLIFKIRVLGVRRFDQSL
ncbi:MAG: rRNA maturation protein [Archaeoglobales archaeon]|nr:rRNA maturation protein [Archaeoglobales archaeon]